MTSSLLNTFTRFEDRRCGTCSFRLPGKGVCDKTKDQPERGEDHDPCQSFYPHLAGRKGMDVEWTGEEYVLVPSG